MPGRKGEKGLLLVGHEKVPHGSGLTGDGGCDTVDGARTKGLPEPRTSTSFPEIWYPGLGKGEKERLCICGCSKLEYFNEDVKSLL